MHLDRMEDHHWQNGAVGLDMTGSNLLLVLIPVDLVGLSTVLAFSTGSFFNELIW